MNKNMIAGDKSAVTPGGIRLGTPALTSRGLNEKDFEQVAVFLDRAIKIALKAQEKVHSLRILIYAARAVPSSLTSSPLLSPTLPLLLLRLT